MNAPTTSHASLIAEVAALRASLNDAVELCESLRSERDTKQRACDALKDHIDQQTNDAVKLRADRDALRAVVEEALTWRGTDTTHAKLRAALGRSAL